jgi:hypothetical protein
MRKASPRRTAVAVSFIVWLGFLELGLVADSKLVIACPAQRLKMLIARVE